MIYKATVIIADDNVHNAYQIDVIEDADDFWLVPEWLESPDGKTRRPARIVSLATLPHQRGKDSPEFVVDDPVPKYVFDGRIPPQEASKYIVIEAPEILFPIEPKPKLH